MEQVNSVGVTDYELAALVDMVPTPSGRRVLDAVGIVGLLDDATALRAGYASLLVRDIAGLDGEAIVASGFGAALGTMLSSADDILQLVLTRDDAVIGRTVLVDATLGGFLLDMTSYGVHAAQPLGEVDLLDLLHDIICNLADAEPRPFGVQVTRFPLDGETRAARLTIVEPRGWQPEGGDVTSDAEAWGGVRSSLGPSDAEAKSAPRRAH